MSGDAALRHDAPASFDLAPLATWLSARVGPLDRPLQAHRFKGGQSNPTYLLSAGSRRWVMRKKPDGVLLPSAHAVEREYRVITALGASDVPVPRTFGLCEDASVIGTPFYVMEHLDGRVYWDPTLPELDPAGRAAVFDAMNAAVASLHRVDPAAVGLGDYGRPGQYLARQVDRWTRQYRASETTPIPEMDRLIEWLPQHLPPDDGPARIVHGDLRLDNMMFAHETSAGGARVLALLDWELSTLGDPLADFAYHALTWILTAGEFRGMAGAPLDALGIPPLDDYMRLYCERVGRPPIEPARWNYMLVFSLFRLAAILQGIAKRVEEGTAASAEARETGARARPIAEAAWRQRLLHP